VSSKNDSRPHFEFAIAMPADRAYAALIRELVVHGSRQAGSAEEAALSFALTVEDAVRTLVGEVTSDQRLGVFVRMEHALQVTLTLGADTRTLTLDM
jgi:hypothetical protein